MKQWLRSLVLAPLALSACGRVMGSELELHELGSVVPSRDAGAGDAGVSDAGARGIFSCSPYGQSSSGTPYVFDGGGLADEAYCQSICPSSGDGPIKVCQPVDGNDVLCWVEFCGVGRLTDGVTPLARASNALGGHLANMAAHEAGAALAFTQLANELEQHRVEPRLVRRARRAAREEQRHARLVGALATAHGASFGVATPAAAATRTLEAIALENAAEGCVRETLGALIGAHQALHATDACVR